MIVYLYMINAAFFEKKSSGTYNTDFLNPNSPNWENDVECLRQVFESAEIAREKWEKTYEHRDTKGCNH